MTGICAALAFLFALLVLCPAPSYNLQPSPVGHPIAPAAPRTTP